MSLVEYLGLKYIFSDSFDNDVNKLISGFVSSIGLIGWIIMIFVKPTLLDKGATVFNLLIAIILFVLLIIRLFKEKRKFDFLCLAVTIVAFVIGLFKTYHSLFFPYEYTKIFSGIATTLYSSVILNIIGIFFYKKHSLIDNIVGSFKFLALVIAGFVFIFLLGQAVTVLLYFTKSYSFYDKIVIYHDIEFNKIRERYDLKDAPSGIISSINYYFSEIDSYTEDDINCVTQQSTSLFEADKKCRKDSLGKNLNSSVTKRRGYNILNITWENNDTFVIKTVDLEWSKAYYVKYNIREKQGEEVNEDYYNNIINNK